MTKFNTIQNDKEFNKVKGMFADSQGKANERLQALIEYGISRLPETNDTSHLSQALNIAMSSKMIGTKAVKEYIQAHVNVKWLKTTDGTYKFKRDGKEWDIKEVNETFWESNAAKKLEAKADFLDPIAELKATVARLMKAKEAGKIPADRVTMLEDLTTRVKDLLDVKALTPKELKAFQAAPLQA